MGKKKKKTKKQLTKKAEKMSVPLSLCMIVKNEEEYLETCLKSIKDIVNEIIIIDTGSTDNTKEIASRFTSIIFDFEWNNSFSDARNFALKKASSEWIIMLDADECIDRVNKQKLVKLLKNPSEIAYMLHFRSDVRKSGAGSVIINAHPRLFKNRAGIFFKGRVHEQIIHSVAKAGGNIALSDVTIEHKGYAPDVFSSRKKIERNINLLNLEVSEDPGNSFAWFNLGESYSLNMSWEPAIEAYNRALTAGPLPAANRGLLHQNLATAYLHSNRYIDALEQSDMALELVPALTSPHLVKAEAAKSLERFDLAVSELNTVISKLNTPLKTGNQLLQYEPDWNFIYLKLAENHRLANNIIGAENAYKNLLVINPQNGEALLWLGRIARQKEEFSKARSYFSKGNRFFPDEPLFLLELAGCFKSENNNQQALNTYKKVLNIDKNNAEARYFVQSISGEGEIKANNIETLLELPPSSGLLQEYINVSNLLLQQNRTDDAENIILKGLSIAPDNPAVLYLDALLKDMKQDIQGVISRCIQIMELNPGQTHVLFLLGNKYLSLKDYDKAIEAYTRADSIEPDIREILFNLAVAHIRKNELEQAKGYFQRIVLKYPEDENAKRKLEAICLKIKLEKDGVNTG